MSTRLEIFDLGTSSGGTISVTEGQVLRFVTCSAHLKSCYLEIWTGVQVCRAAGLHSAVPDFGYLHLQH